MTCRRTGVRGGRDTGHTAPCSTQPMHGSSKPQIVVNSDLNLGPPPHTTCQLPSREVCDAAPTPAARSDHAGCSATQLRQASRTPAVHSSTTRSTEQDQSISDQLYKCTILFMSCAQRHIQYQFTTVKQTTAKCVERQTLIYNAVECNINLLTRIKR